MKANDMFANLRGGGDFRRIMRGGDCAIGG